MDYYNSLSVGSSPITLSVMKSYMKIISTSDDVLIQSLIDACTEYGESYTGREFRANNWELFIDTFLAEIIICKNPIDTITSIEHLVSSVLTVVPNTDYYKIDNTRQSEILLVSGKSWPSNTDDREHPIKITFVTKAYYKINTIEIAIMRHVQYLYRNRGDCLDLKQSAGLCGTDLLYNTMRISRI